MAGFEFRETMSGSFHLVGDPHERPFSFTVRARSPRWLAFWARPEVELEGEVDAEGFADHRRLRGTLGLDVLRTGALPYRFWFRANDGTEVWFEGKKTFQLAQLVESMTFLPGTLLDATGTSVGSVLLRFDLQRDLVGFVKSFQLA